MAGQQSSEQKYVSKQFDKDAYIRRIRFLRAAMGGDQLQFAQQIGIPYKRWNRYERGFAIPRGTAMLLYDKLGVSAEWLWYGLEGNMPKKLLADIKKAETRPEQKEFENAQRELRKAQERLAAAKKALGEKT